MVKHPMKTWRKVEKVEKIYRFNGRDAFDGRDFTVGQTYQPIGITFQIYSDRSRELCYIIENDKGVVALTSTKHFKVVN